jgi:hypothetical protein
MSTERDDTKNIELRYLKYFVVPAMFVPGVLDWLWHKQMDIEHTAGTQESITHLLMLLESGTPIVAALFFEPNALLLTVALSGYVAHEATAAWDLNTTDHRRRVPPREQLTHSFQEQLPLVGLSLLICTHWDQFQAIFGKGHAEADWKLRLKRKKLPKSDTVSLLAAVGIFLVLPYANELYRCTKAASRHREAPGSFESPRARRIA